MSKLRKNPKIKDALGVKFISGRDVLNVASALSRPMWLNKKSNLSFLACLVGRRVLSTLSGLAADADILYKHTTLFDRILVRIFSWSFYSSGIFIMILVFLESFGFWDK